MQPLAVQLYTVRELLKDDLRPVIERIAQIGYGAVEPYDTLTDPAGARKILDDNGLRVTSTHAPLLTDNRDAALDGTATLGADTAIVPAVGPDRWTSKDSVARIADELNQVAEVAATRGLTVGYHNHYWELEESFDGQPALEYFASRLSPEVILEIDLYWAATGGVDVPALLSRLGDRVRFLHVKDGPMNKTDPMTAVGGGSVDIDGFLAAAPADAWRIVELDECATDIVEAIADSYTYLSARR